MVPGSGSCQLRRRWIGVVLALGLASMAGVAAGDEPRGVLGISIEVDGEGFFLNPTLKTVTIVAVTPASPAASAGIAVKDQILEADGHRVAGAKGRDLEPLLKKAVGQSLRLVLKRPNGEEYAAVLVAAARPAKP